MAAAVIVLILLCGVMFCFRRRRQKHNARRCSDEKITPLSNTEGFVSPTLSSPDTLGRDNNGRLMTKGYSDAIFPRGARNFVTAPGGASAADRVEPSQRFSTEHTVYSDDSDRITLPPYNAIDWSGDRSQQMRGTSYDLPRRKNG